MKKIIFISLMLPFLMMISCKKDITSMNVDPKSPTIALASSLFTTGQHSLVNLMANENQGIGITNLIDQYWAETIYIGESNYDLSSRNVTQNFWDALYRDALKNLEEAKKLVPVTVNDPVIQQNDIAIADIMQVYSYYYLVTTFGNIPYKEALDVEKTTTPKYDDQKTVYYDLLTRLDADIASLTTISPSFGKADVIYNGNVAKWKKFANSFKLKMGITIADYDDAKAKATIESAVAGGVFTSNTDNGVFNYLSTPPNANPYWTDQIQGGRFDFVAANTIVDLLNANNDPRLPYYFTFNGTGSGYTGGIPGSSNNFASFSKPSGPLLVAGSIGKISNPDFPYTLLSYDEVEFILAEAAERGYNVGGTATAHYNKAITASILYWGGTADQAVAYLLQPSVAYLTATGNYKQKIGIQKYMALYMRSLDAWIEVRRLKYPVLIAPASARSVFPLRYTYPVNEPSLNGSNYSAAATAIGGDNVGTKLFWEVN